MYAYISTHVRVSCESFVHVHHSPRLQRKTHTIVYTKGTQLAQVRYGNGNRDESAPDSDSDGPKWPTFFPHEMLPRRPRDDVVATVAGMVGAPPDAFACWPKSEVRVKWEALACPV